MTPRVASQPEPSPPVPQTDPFRYGWRDVQRTCRDGTVVWERVPLTLDDVLHPREGDTLPENTLHNRQRDYLSDVCWARVADRRGALVLSDCLIDWGRAELRDHSPDLAILFGVADPERRRGKFYVALEGTLPVLALEIVSPDTRVNDVVRKFEEYYRAGVPLYFLVDQEREDGPRHLLGYRHTPSGYQSVPLDEQGRLLLEPVGLLLGLRDNRIVCFDAATGEELGDYTQERQARVAAEELARQQAEARQAAEQQAREQAETRQAAEQRLRELEAELQRLRGETSP